MNMTSSKPETIKVITGVQRRRRWTTNEKASIVEETYVQGSSLSEVARHHDISPSQLFQWRRRYEEGALIGVGSEEIVVPESEAKLLHKRIRELERVLGQKTMENEILKEAVKIGREKKLILRKPLRGIEGFE